MEELKERQSYVHMQQVAKTTIEYIKETIKPGVEEAAIGRYGIKMVSSMNKLES